MDSLIVGIIIVGALIFTVRGFIKAYKGESSCNCGGCSRASKENCNVDFPVINKK
ncbi:MAG: FeoB-associated Cys-rich membrane protein [Pseudomonadota bacterium]